MRFSAPPCTYSSRPMRARRGGSPNRQVSRTRRRRRTTIGIAIGRNAMVEQRNATVEQRLLAHALVNLAYAQLLLRRAAFNPCDRLLPGPRKSASLEVERIQCLPQAENRTQRSDVSVRSLVLK